MAEAYIVDALRTAGGRRNGALRDWHPADMGAAVIDALLAKSGIDPAAVDDVIVGCVSQVGEQSFHVGRNMVLASSLPETVPAVTIDRQCGSSQQALHFAAQAVMSGTQDIVLAAGVEHMTRVPMGTPTILAMQAGIGKGPWSEALLEKFGVTEFSQFTGAQMIADRYGFTREWLDVFALESHRRAAIATDAGAFDDEIVPLRIVGTDGEETLHTRDEGVRRDASLEGLAGLKTIKPGGVITAGNASQLSDGASACVVMDRQLAEQRGALLPEEVVGILSQAAKALDKAHALVLAIEVTPRDRAGEQIEITELAPSALGEVIGRRLDINTGSIQRIMTQDRCQSGQVAWVGG